MKQTTALALLGHAFATAEEIDVIRTEIAENGWNAAQVRFRSSRTGLMSILAKTNRSGTLATVRQALRAESDPNADIIAELMMTLGYSRSTTPAELRAELERLRAINGSKLGRDE